MAELMQYEKDQVEAANASGKKPVVFVHGLVADTALKFVQRFVKP